MKNSIAKRHMTVNSVKCLEAQSCFAMLLFEPCLMHDGFLSSCNGELFVERFYTLLDWARVHIKYNAISKG